MQSVIGSLLYYGRAIDATILPALNQLGQQQATPTLQTKKALNQLLDYVYTYPNGKVRFYASDMCLTVDSDAAYLVLPKARSRIAGHFRLLDLPSKVNRSLYNGSVLVECRMLRHVVSSAAEAETNGVFQNAKLAVPLRHLLNKMGHPQSQTVINTDNSTSSGFVHDNIQLKQSKSWDMNLHWLRDKETQKDFKVTWSAGKSNTADYFSKVTHTIRHHRQQRPNYVRD